MSQPTSTPGNPGPQGRARRRLRAARATGEDFESLVDDLEEYPYPEFEDADWIVTICSRVGVHAARLIQGLRPCEHLPPCPRRRRLFAAAEAWAEGAAEALRRVQILAELTYEACEEREDGDWLVDLHDARGRASRRVARLEAYLAGAT
jgi:hypothetical protein